MSNNIFISIIMPVYNAGDTIYKSLQAIFNSTYSQYECVVVDDSSTDRAFDSVKDFPFTLIKLKDGNRGPSFARNKGAEIARGNILLFIDADVVIEPCTLEKVALAFQEHPEIDALFGSYDDSPAQGNFVSQYKNLTHAWFHQQANEDGSTFWSGCGAIRKSVFIKAGGFDLTRYPKPSIEDIDLGYRIKTNGGKIWVNKDVTVKHLKRWTFWNMVKTDIFGRAIPWTRLILRKRNLPNDLNLDRKQRINAIIAFLLSAWLLLNLVWPAGNVLLIFFGLLPGLANVWDWEKVRRHKPEYFIVDDLRGPGLYALISILLCIGAAWINQWLFSLIPLAILLVSWVLLPVVKVSNRLPGKTVYSIQLVGLITFILSIVIYSPAWFTIPLLSFSLLILLLSKSLFRYYYIQRGLLFALACLPMQVFYYLYSTFSFGVGFFLFIVDSIPKSKSSIIKTDG